MPSIVRCVFLGKVDQETKRISFGVADSLFHRVDLDLDSTCIVYVFSVSRGVESTLDQDLSVSTEVASVMLAKSVARNDQHCHHLITVFHP